MKSLLLGCGNSRIKKIYLGDDKEWGELTTLDMNPNCGADVVFDLDLIHAGTRLPFEDEAFDHLAAYDVLEHTCRQGDWRGWFAEMEEFHRVLKPGGTFGIIVPIKDDAFADPGHTRFFQRNYFFFLSQDFYDKALAENFPVTDYRWHWKKNFDVLSCEEIGGHHLGVVLRRA